MDWEIARVISPDEQDDEQIGEIIKNMYVNQCRSMEKNGVEPSWLTIIVKIEGGKKTSAGFKAMVNKKKKEDQ